MFTGLIESTGSVLSFTPTDGAARLTISAPAIAARLQTGDSVSVSGVCLTALAIEPNAFPPRFSADLAAETIARTTLSGLRPGAQVNLELPTPAGTPLGGHVVQGHVDGTATVVSLDPVSPGTSSTDWILRLRLPAELMRYVAAKGSIAVEGISLTVAAVERDVERDIERAEVRIAIIPHTYAATNLHTLAAGTAVNIEVDILAKYAESRAAQPRPPLTVEYLIANGF